MATRPRCWSTGWRRRSPRVARDLGIVTGGEAYRTRIAAKRSDVPLDWARQADDVAPTWTEGSLSIGHPAELAHGIVLPTQAYPMFENALWHDSGRTMAEHLAVVGEMWAGFSRVAAANPHAWRRQAFTASEITTPTPDNRMVGHPYTKRMVSNPDVDMASGLIMCSPERARDLGVPSDRWVFPHAGTDGHDFLMSERIVDLDEPSRGLGRSVRAWAVSADRLLGLGWVLARAWQPARSHGLVLPLRRATSSPIGGRSDGEDGAVHSRHRAGRDRLGAMALRLSRPREARR